MSGKNVGKLSVALPIASCTNQGEATLCDTTISKEPLRFGLLRNTYKSAADGQSCSGQ